MEIIPDDITEPLDESVACTHFTDAILYHDMINDQAATGIVHLLNSTPIDTYSKQQSMVETATYGAEFVAARIATNQIINLCTSLHYLGVPTEGKSQQFGNNVSVIISSTIFHSA
jgi:hypothetical protein